MQITEEDEKLWADDFDYFVNRCFCTDKPSHYHIPYIFFGNPDVARDFADRVEVKYPRGLLKTCIRDSVINAFDTVGHYQESTTNSITTIACYRSLGCLSSPRGLTVHGFIPSGYELEGSDLSDNCLNGSILITTNLTNANLRRIEGRFARFDGAILDNAQLDSSNLANANLTEAHLVNSSLINANLEKANLTGADLRGANLTCANLTGTVLTNASLDEKAFQSITNLATASLKGVKLVGAFSEENLAKARTIEGINLTEATATQADCAVHRVF
jgi:uncharacterized protein YjbI with pentapeptide repeats